MLGTLFTMWHTSTVDGHDHAITDEVMAAGLSEQCAPITAVCGDLVLLTLMEEPPGERCPRCMEFLRARATLRDFEQRERHRHRKPGLVARLLHLAPESPVVPSARVGAQADRSKPPAETFTPVVSAGSQPPVVAVRPDSAAAAGPEHLSAACWPMTADRSEHPATLSTPVGVAGPDTSAVVRWPSATAEAESSTAVRSHLAAVEDTSTPRVNSLAEPVLGVDTQTPVGVAVSPAASPTGPQQVTR